VENWPDSSSALDDTALRRNFQRCGVEQEIASRRWEFAKGLALNFLPFSCSPTTMNTVGVRDSGVGSSLGPHSSRRWRDLEAGAVPRDQGTFRLPGEREGACWKKEQPILCFLFSGAHVLTGSQLTKFESALCQMNIGSGWLLGLRHRRPLSI
jgi:hypothetical protein